MNTDALVGAAYRQDLDLVKAIVAQGVPVNCVGTTYRLYFSERMWWIDQAEKDAKEAPDSFFPEDKLEMSREARKTADQHIWTTPLNAALMGMENQIGGLSHGFVDKSLSNRGYELIDFLLSQGALINATDQLGRTPLMLAVDQDLTAAFVERLLAAGASTTKQTVDGWTIARFLAHKPSRSSRYGHLQLG